MEDLAPGPSSNSSFMLCLTPSGHVCVFFFFKQKTAYEILAYWSSDVCSSDLSRGVERTQPADAPRISVLIATYERPALLAECLEGFCRQTLAPSEFEVVVVDDGSAGPKTQRVLADFAARLSLVHTRIEHSGRSAAKNLALLIARGDLVLWFDDDGRPA